MHTILLATTNRRTIDTVRSTADSECRITVATTSAQLWDCLNATTVDCLLIDLSELEKLSTDQNRVPYPKACINKIQVLRPMMGIVIITPPATVRKAVSYVKHGASDYLTEPVDLEEMRLVLDEISREWHQQSELAYLREQLLQDDPLDRVRTQSPLMKRVYDNVRAVAPTRATVLLLGETGTGKSFTAKLIHRTSNRKDGPFICVHCGAIPDTLIESELFGHEKGAFTGAYRRKAGKFELAAGGTLFLDEIGTISKSAQVKLLTVLQEGTFQRVGGEQNLTANVRVIAASNADLKQMCTEGLFRKDLYYRLNVFPITIPQLCERKEDIPLFVQAFIRNFNQLNAKTIQGAHPEVMQALIRYDWPGNIRELENVLERAHILETTSHFTADSFPSELFEPVDSTAEIAVDTSETLAAAREKALMDVERRYLHAILLRNKGRINASAAEAGVSTRQLNKLMHKHGLVKNTFRATSPT